MHESTLHRLIVMFRHAFEQLNTPVSVKTLEDLAVLIHKAMTVQARNYHNLEHVLALVDPENPIQTLAALFHDIVYYQVDQGFLPEIQSAIAPYIQQQEKAFSLVRGQPAEDRLFALALQAFDMPLGELITPADGLNEFLSAVVMNLKLGEYVSEKALLQMDLCIEATIPFRGSNAAGQTHFEVLAERLQKICQEWTIPMQPTEAREAICMAVKMANTDVESFGDSDPGCFLQKTWRLLPEVNVPLRMRNVYTIREYREALQRTASFFQVVDPDNIFHHYDGVPSPADFKQMTMRARHNIAVGQVYLRLKLLSQAILEALAEESGGDAPLSLFMGDLPVTPQADRLENYLPPVERAAWVDQDPIIYGLLSQGRQETPDFDLDVSPLTLFVYLSLPPEKTDQAVRWAQAMFDGQLSHVDFLRRLDANVVKPIARASARMVFTRSEKLLAYG